MSSRAFNDLYQLSCQDNFEQLLDLSVSLKRFYKPTNIFLKEVVKEVSFRADRVDRVADNLIPEHYIQDNAKPITTRGDGNCLFNATSLALCGSEKLSAELRVRTTFEIVQILEFYKNHPMLLTNEFKAKSGSPWSIASLFHAIVFSNDSCDVSMKNGFDDAVKYEARRTACSGTFSGLLQIMGLASAIGCQIHLIYPDTRHSMLSLLNGIYRPRPGTIVSGNYSPDSVVIMWTNISGWPDRTKEFRVNHFVPVLPINTQKSEPVFWNLVGRKRNIKQSVINTSRRGKSRKTCSYEKSPAFSTSAKTAKEKGTLEQYRQPHLSPKNNYSTSVRTTKRKSTVEHWPQPQASPKSRKLLDQDSKLHFSMPLLTRSWFEKNSSEEANTAHSLRSDSHDVILTMPTLSHSFHCKSTNANDTDQVILSMPRLSYSFYGKSTVANNTEQVILRMPLLSHNFYSKSTADCTKSTVHTECTDTLNTENIGSSGCNENGILNLRVNENEQILGDCKQLGHNEETTGFFEVTLPCLSNGWYKRRGRLSAKNHNRRAQSSATKRIVVNDKIIAVQNPPTGKGIEESIQYLSDQMQKELNKNKRAELHAVIKVAEFFLNSGPIVPTQEAGKVYAKEKNLFLGLGFVEENLKKQKSSHLFNVLSRHLNVVQVYLHGKAYLVESDRHSDSKIKTVVDLLNTFSPPTQKVVNDYLQHKLASIYKDSLKFMDTKRDRDILKGLFAKATSVNFTAKLQGTQNKTAVMNCRDELCGNLSTFAEIEKTSMIVNNSMTNEQQRLVTKRIIDKRKEKEMKLKIDSRGRMLKHEQWPELAKTLEYIFNIQDLNERAGCGLEAHPRLKNDILFRSKDNNTFMWQAHKIINAISPPSFNISLSSCYNYTMTYKVNSASAKRHHHGMEVNAKISLLQPPHTKVDRLVVNLHYSTAVVNYACDYASLHEESTLVDSKDAKRIVCGDVAPVQQTGKVWTNSIEYLDHDWDQSRANAVTPMTHLFLRTETVKRVDNVIHNPTLCEANLHSPHSNTVLHVTRTGKAITLINPSFLERETTIRLFNEILLLLTKPSLDSAFRNPKTGKLKEEFIFIVDNGPAEEPSSPLVQMLLVRLQRLLNLDRVVQLSFAEYHSKRNFVERVHATENKLLSRHGPFSSSEVHKDRNIQLGSKHHVDNMEKMTENVIDCLRQGRYHGKPLEVFRGVKNEWFLFNDELQLKDFLSRSEEAKHHCDLKYIIQKKSPLLPELVALWNIDENFEGKYIDDYRTLNNTKNREVSRTAWIDRYICAVFRDDDEWRGRHLPRQEYQAIPDYIRWIQTNGELHYVSFERLQLLLEHGSWQETPGLFRPDRLLDLLFTLNDTPLNDVYASLAVLVWLPQTTVEEYFKQKREQLRYDLEQDKLREKWRKHPLYTKKVDELCALCKEKGLPTKGQKHHLVRQLVEVLGDTQEESKPGYDGDLKRVQTSMSELRKLSIARIRYILNYHGITVCGTKEELVLRLFLVCHGKYHLCFEQEENEILRTIRLAEEILQEEKRQFVLNRDDVYRKRTYTTKKSESQLQVPYNTNFENMQRIFEPVKNYVQILRKIRIEKSTELSNAIIGNTSYTQNQPATNHEEYEDYFSIGTKIKVRWTKDEIGDSGWRCGWYTAQVQEGHLEEDVIQVLYFSEPECVYSVCVSEYLALGKLKLA